MKSDRDPIQEFCLTSERNLRIAAAVGDAWPEARGKLVVSFFDRLDARLKRRLKGWNSEHAGHDMFVRAYSGYWISNPKWRDQYGLGLMCPDLGRTMVFGLYRQKDEIGKRPFCPGLIEAVGRLHPSARQLNWWEASITMRSPASEWRRADVLWAMHSDPIFLEDVASQLLEIATISKPLLDRFMRRK